MKRLLFIFLSLNFSAIAALPANSLLVPASEMKNFKNMGLTRAESQSVIDEFQNIMGESLLLDGKILKVQLEWHQDDVDAYCTRDDQENPLIVIQGGLVRHSHMSKDMLMMILCHELGHYQGGAPKAPRGNSGLRSWSSAEGQADYYATSKCFPQIIEARNKATSYYQIQKCQSPNCNPVIATSLKLSQFYATLYHSRLPDLAHKDPTQQVRTHFGHPSAQCRLDTMIAGALCPVDYRTDFDSETHTIGACFRSNPGLEPEFARPSCWFNPDKY